jgi:hypothetical protein
MFSRGDEMFSRGDEMFSRGDEMFSRGDEMLSRGDEMLSRGDEMFSRVDEMFSRGDEMFSPQTRMIIMINSVEKSGRGLIKSAARDIPGGTEKNPKPACQNNRYSSLGSNREIPGCRSHA